MTAGIEMGRSYHDTPDQQVYYFQLQLIGHTVSALQHQFQEYQIKVLQMHLGLDLKHRCLPPQYHPLFEYHRRA